jgi:hypothetical protein
MSQHETPRKHRGAIRRARRSGTEDSPCNHPLRLSPGQRRGFPAFSALNREPGSAGRGAWTVSHRGPEGILLEVRSGGSLEPSLRLDAAAARRLAGELLAFAGAIDGSASD